MKRIVDPQEAYQRVDAARRLMHVPARAAEATGRLFFAKRLHEAAKRGDVDLDALLADVLDDLAGAAARAGARDEHDRWVPSPT